MCFTALGAASMLAVEEAQGSQYLEPEASLQRNLPVVSQVYKTDRRSLVRIYSVQSVCSYKPNTGLCSNVDGGCVQWHS